jgi:hypothetical protein
MGGISINDLRKNLNEINDFMEQECASAAARYGVELDASLITGIDPPQEVESALAAINTAHNEVSSDISLAKAQADQTIVQSKRAVEIETLRAEAEVEPLQMLAAQLRALKESGPDVLAAYLRNVRLDLYKKAETYSWRRRQMSDVLITLAIAVASFFVFLLGEPISAGCCAVWDLCIVEEGYLPRLRAVWQGRRRARRAGSLAFSG